MPKHNLTYKERLAAFQKGSCPYCHADGATLEPNKRGMRGYCVVCHAECNFTLGVKNKKRSERGME